MCGLDIQDTLARNVLRGRTKRELATPENVEEKIDTVGDMAKILGESYATAQVHVALAPGVEPEETEIAPGVKTVQHPDNAAETLYVDFGDDPPSILESRVESVTETLEALGWRTEITSMAKDVIGTDMRIRAVPSNDHPLESES
ncbi:hypothetical protein [Halorhabdus tiamatea]|uniref:hypothetical protein n=1 Tax=Halorhabdus tiamatea TaxID=430914 RepID=UPI000212104A|nr:hypothetical protein [Halorhabdus tiamatea]